MKYDFSVTGERNLISRTASTRVVCGFKLKKTAISPNCRSQSRIATGSPVLLAMLAARLEINVVLPLFPFGLKKEITRADERSEARSAFLTAACSSSGVNGLIIYPCAPPRSSLACASESQRRERQMIRACPQFFLRSESRLTLGSQSISRRIRFGLNACICPRASPAV